MSFDKVCLVGGGRWGDPRIGTPHVAGASVTGKVLGEIAGPKLVIQKFKRRKNQRRRTGFGALHRDPDRGDSRLGSVMAHKKGQGSTRNGRDSNRNTAASSATAGQLVHSGTIIVRQLARSGTGPQVRRGQGRHPVRDRARRGPLPRSRRVDVIPGGRAAAQPAGAGRPSDRDRPPGARGPQPA
jgi:hypothetical protein